MSIIEANRAQVAGIWEAMARGDTAPFADAMADNFVWRMQGTTPWSGTYTGKADVRGRMLRALMAQFATPYRSVAQRIHADGDFVIVEHRGDVTTKRGRPYNNSYCFVIRMRDGRMVELTEYFDSALVERELEPPPWA